MSRLCRMCGRPLTAPAPDGVGPVCRRKNRPAARPGHTQPALEEITVTLPARTVNEWNARYPVGTPVVAYPDGRPEDFPNDERLVTRTRSRASVLGGHTAVVWVDGHSACIALSHVDPQRAEETHAGFDLAGDPATHSGLREKCPDPACETPTA